MRLRDIIGRISLTGGHRETMRDVRRLLVGGLAMGRRSASDLEDRLAGMARIEAMVDAELERWLEPEDIEAGGSGPFDACDLRVWVQQVQEAGIAVVPVTPLLSVHHDDLDRILPAFTLPPAYKARYAKMLGLQGDHGTASEGQDVGEPEGATVSDGPAPADPDPVASRMVRALSDVLDDIPPSWMIRTHVCGSSTLKALVGTGLMLKGDDVAEIAPGVRIGAGWVQRGNRRHIDFADPRFLKRGGEGHKPVTHYLARPWVEPRRFHEGEDIHRANSPLAGPGKWPVEWRVFVRNGRVSGVSNYYGWAGDGATPENAYRAIEAACLGQRLTDHMVGRGLQPVFMDTLLLRAGASRHPAVAEALSAFDPDGFHGTLDFIETRSGTLFLEAGPAHAPGGGGHPCAFAGQGVPVGSSGLSVADCRGVAFLPMQHVSLGDPLTWVDGDPGGNILDWAAVISLAEDHVSSRALDTDESSDSMTWDEMRAVLSERILPSADAAPDLRHS